MPRTTSPEALAAMFAQQTSEVILPFLIINEEQLAEPIYVVHNTVDQVRDRGDGNGSKTYVALKFGITPPSEDAGTIRQTTLVIDNLSGVIRDAIELATGQPTVILEYVRAADLNGTPEAGPFEFVIENASYDVQLATFTLRYTEVFRLRYPQHSFIPAFFPDLFD